jgi:hypothetical protein
MTDGKMRTALMFNKMPGSLDKKRRKTVQSFIKQRSNIYCITYIDGTFLSFLSNEPGTVLI